jgi:hypothetical protein
VRCHVPDTGDRHAATRLQARNGHDGTPRLREPPIALRENQLGSGVGPLGEHTDRAHGGVPRRVAMTEPVGEANQDAVRAARERGVVTAMGLARIRATEDPDARAPRRARIELARPHAHAFPEAYVDVDFVGELEHGGEPYPQTPLAPREPTLQSRREIDDPLPPIGGDDLDPPLFASLCSPHDDDPGTCVHALIVRELARDVHEGGGRYLAQPDLGRDGTDALAD